MQRCPKCRGLLPSLVHCCCDLVLFVPMPSFCNEFSVRVTSLLGIASFETLCSSCLTDTPRSQARSAMIDALKNGMSTSQKSASKHDIKYFAQEYDCSRGQPWKRTEFQHVSTQHKSSWESILFNLIHYSQPRHGTRQSHRGDRYTSKCKWS